MVGTLPVHPCSALMSCPRHCPSVQLLWRHEDLNSAQTQTHQTKTSLHGSKSGIMQESHFSVRQAISCASLVHNDLCGSLDEPSVHAKRCRAIIPRTSPEDRRDRFGLRICSGSQVSSVFVFSRDAFECDSFALEMHPGADGEEMLVCLFVSRSEPLLASIVKSQCCVSPHSSTPVGAKYENIFMHDKFAERKHKASVGVSANGIFHWQLNWL